MRPAWIAIGTFFVVVLCAVLFFAIRITEGPSQAVRKTATASSSVTLLSVKDSYSKGTHTVSGSVLVPTVCTPLTATSSVSETAIRVDVNSTEDTKVCLQLPATTTFKISADADIDTPVQIYVNGTLATTTS
jgi:hypothetical protein